MKGKAYIACGKRAYQKLSLSTDIKHAALLSHRYSETSQD